MQSLTEYAAEVVSEARHYFEDTSHVATNGATVCFDMTCAAGENAPISLDTAMATVGAPSIVNIPEAAELTGAKGIAKKACTHDQPLNPFVGNSFCGGRTL